MPEPLTEWALQLANAIGSTAGHVFRGLIAKGGRGVRQGHDRVNLVSKTRDVAAKSIKKARPIMSLEQS